MTDRGRPRNYAPTPYCSSRLAWLVVVLLAGALSPSAASARKKPRPQPCPGGVFPVIGEALVPSGAPPFEDLLEVGGGTVSIASGCPAAKPRIKAMKRGTRVKVSWHSCPGLRGRRRL